MHFLDWLCGVRGRQLGIRSLKRLRGARHRSERAACISLLEPRTLLTGPSITSVSYDGDPLTQGSMGWVFRRYRRLGRFQQLLLRQPD